MPRKLKVDFSDTQSREVLPEGDYVVKVVEIDEREGPKGPYLNWELEVATGPYKGRKVWNNTSLAPQSLWVLRATLEALGLNVISGAMTLDLQSYIGLTMGITVGHRVYQGKTRVNVIDVFPLEEFTESLEDDFEGGLDLDEEDFDEDEDDLDLDEEDLPDEEPEPIKPRKKKRRA